RVHRIREGLQGQARGYRRQRRRPPHARRGGGALRGDRGRGRAGEVCLRGYEAIEDVLGRLISYAGLLYAGNTTDPAIAKFYGDMQERITAASLHLLFFTLELNRLDDDLLDKAMADPALGHYRPWIED